MMGFLTSIQTYRDKNATFYAKIVEHIKMKDYVLKRILLSKHMINLLKWIQGRDKLSYLNNLLGELCGDSDVDVSIGDALPPAAEGWGTNDMMSSSNTLQHQ